MEENEGAMNDTQARDEEEELEAQLAYENLKRRREAKKRKRIITIVAAALVVVVLGIVFFANGAGSEEPQDSGFIATSVVYVGDFNNVISANGATEPVSSTVVTPEVDGIIENLQVSEGSVVNAGDVLFTLKNESLDKDVREANVAVESAQRAVNSANSAVDEAYAAYNSAAKEYNETGEGIFDESSLRSAIRSAEDGYAMALSELESARTRLAEAQANANKRTVTAPVSGTIVSMTATNGAGYGSFAGTGQGASANGSLMQISDLSQMKVTVQVNEVDISSIEEGQAATATFSALPGVSLDAQVVHIASVSSGTGGESMGGGVVTYAVDLIIPQPDPKLKPGMTASVSITTQSVPNAIIVPASAVHEGDEGACVSVVLDEQTQETVEVPVQVIAQNSSEAAVLGELQDGDLVDISGDMSFDEGSEWE